MMQYITNGSIKYIVEEAKKRGYHVEFIDKDLYYIQSEKEKIYFHHEISEKSSAFGYKICKAKHLTKIFLNLASISTPEGKVFSTVDYEKALSYAKDQGFNKIIMKPNSGMKGRDVFINIDSEEAFEAAYKAILSGDDEVIVEKKFLGQEYRVWATQKKALAVINRIPANVTGDGVHSISKLIEIKNEDKRRTDNDLSPLRKIRVDQHVLKFLEKQELSLEYVPKAKEKIYLRENSNLATGGDSLNITDIAHKSVLDLAVKAINSIPGLLYGGVDFMTTDITKEQTKDSYSIIEINASAGISSCHAPAVGPSVNAAAEILNIVFGEK